MLNSLVNLITKFKDKKNEEDASVDMQNATDTIANDIPLEQENIEIKNTVNMQEPVNVSTENNDTDKFVKNTGKKNNFNKTNPKQNYQKQSKQTLPPNTVYNAVKFFKTEFSRKDLRKISNAIRDRYYKIYGEQEPDKIEQIEDGKKYLVYCYPETMRKEIRNIVAWFYRIKQSRTEKHQRLLSLERLEKLKRTESPDYELELVRFNMAEEEKRKQKKLLADQAKKDVQPQKPNKFVKTHTNKTNSFNKANQNAPNFNKNYKKTTGAGTNTNKPYKGKKDVSSIKPTYKPNSQQKNTPN